MRGGMMIAMKTATVGLSPSGIGHSTSDIRNIFRDILTKFKGFSLELYAFIQGTHFIFRNIPKRNHLRKMNEYCQ